MADERFPKTGLFLKGRLRHAMSDPEKALLEDLVAQSERFSESHTICKRGQRMTRSTILIEGFMIRSITENGHRHIVGLHVPGDFVDLHAFALQRLDHDVVTIGPTRVGYVEHGDLQMVLAERPHLARLLWFSTLLDAAIHRQWIMKMEQLSADGRLAHLIAEVWKRLDLVGLADTHGFGLPLTQADLADTCGTTAIHMNRSVRKLRVAGIAELRRGRVSVPDRAALEAYANFTPDYLYGEGGLQVRDELDPDE